MFRFLSIILLSSISINLSSQNISYGPKSSNIETDKFIDTIVSQKFGPKIFFPNKSKDLKTVVQGSELTYKFEFTNIGNESLLISNVRSSCHCTIASFPKTPISPGESEYITLNLDTKMLGKFNKRVGVYSNAINDFDESINKSRILLKISWEVVEETNTLENKSE